LMPSNVTLNGVSFGPRPAEATSWAFSRLVLGLSWLPSARAGSGEGVS
jgi:hypothetical protein